MTILLADYCDQLTIIDNTFEIKPHLPYYKVETKAELHTVLRTLTAENPWFYIEVPDFAIADNWFN